MTRELKTLMSELVVASQAWTAVTSLQEMLSDWMLKRTVTLVLLTILYGVLMVCARCTY